MNRFKCLLFACISALLLCACGEETATEPGTGVYVAKTASTMGIEVGVDAVFEGGFRLDLRDHGKGRIYLDDQDASFKWTLDGTDFFGIGGGAELSGTMQDGVLVLKNVMGSGVDMTMVCENYTGADTLLERLRKVKNGEQVYNAADAAPVEEQSEIFVSNDIESSDDASGDIEVADQTASSDEYGSAFAGDWEGMTFVYDSSGETKKGRYRVFDDYVYATFARIKFDEDGQLKMDMLGVGPVPELNYEIDNAYYDEESNTLACSGKLCGGEFSAIINDPAASNGVLTFSGRTNGEVKSNYVVYLKRLDAEWERSDAALIGDKEYNVYCVNNRPLLMGKTLEERIDTYKESGVDVDRSGFLEP